MLEYARAIYSGAGAQSVAKYAAEMQAVTSEQLRSVMERYLDPAVLRTAVVRGRTP